MAKKPNFQRKKRAEPDQNKVQEIDVETDIERAEDRESEKRAEYNESEEKTEDSESEQRENRQNEEIAEDREGEVRAENHEDNIVVEIYNFEYDSDDSDNEQDQCENERTVYFMPRNKRFIPLHKKTTLFFSFPQLSLYVHIY